MALPDSHDPTERTWAVVKDDRMKSATRGGEVRSAMEEPDDDADLIGAVRTRIRALRTWSHLSPKVKYARQVRKELREGLAAADPDTRSFQETLARLDSINEGLTALLQEQRRAEAEIRDTQWVMVLLQHPEDM